MAYSYIRTNKKTGRRYLYVEESYRDPATGKVRKRYLSCTPLDGYKRKKPSVGWFDVPGLTAPNLVVSGFLVGLLALRGELKRPDGQTRKSDGDHSQRAKSVANHDLRELYAKYLMDDSDPDRFKASFDRLPKEMQDEVVTARTAIFGTYEEDKDHLQSKDAPAPAPVADQHARDMQEFADRINGMAAPMSDPSEAPIGEDKADSDADETVPTE